MHPPKLIRNYANTEKRYNRWLQEPELCKNGQPKWTHVPTLHVCPKTILDSAKNIKPAILSGTAFSAPRSTAVSNEKKPDLHSTAPSTFEPNKLLPRPAISSQRKFPLSEFSYEASQVAEGWFDLRHRIPVELPSSFVHEFGLAYRHINSSDQPNSIVVHPLLSITSVPFESVMFIEEDRTFLYGLVTKQDGKYGCYRTKVSAKDWAPSQRGLHLLAERRSELIIAESNLNKRSLAKDVLHVLEDADSQDDELLRPCKHETPVSPFLFIPTNLLGKKRRKTLEKIPASRTRLKLGLKISSSKIIRDRSISTHRPSSSLHVGEPRIEEATSQDPISMTLDHAAVDGSHKKPLVKRWQDDSVRSTSQKLVIRIPRRAVDRRDVASAYQNLWVETEC